MPALPPLFYGAPPRETALQVGATDSLPSSLTETYNIDILYVSQTVSHFCFHDNFGNSFHIFSLLNSKSIAGGNCTQNCHLRLNLFPHSLPRET